MIAPTQQELQAAAFKTAANALFAAHRHADALAAYTSAISLAPSHLLYSNRSLTHLKLELYAAAVDDATQSVHMEGGFAKGYFRRANGYLAMGKLAEAITDLKQVLKLEPGNAEARKTLNATIKERKALAFAEAISFEDTKISILERLGNIEESIVEDSYTGPKLESEITLEFVKDMLEHMKSQKILHKKYALKIMLAAKTIFDAQPPIVDIAIPEDSRLTVCGDIHGQFYDVLNIFEKNGLPSPTNMYLFNGDFVDRGSFSVECILTLFAFKALCPDSIHLSRGNHETNDMNRAYGFEGEVKYKYSELVFKFFAEIFNGIPVGNLVGGKILVIHGGLFSRDDVTLDELRKINRFRQPGSTGLMTELLWSDPMPEMGRSLSKRGIGLQFGPDVTAAFLKLNDLTMIIRSHEVKDGGYEIAHNGQLVTLFSAPNYCDSVNNLGAYMKISPTLEIEYVQFSAVPHPDVKAMKYASSVYGGGM